MIYEWLLPWKSHSMIQYPFAMPVFMFLLATLLSVVTWRRQRKTNKKN